MKRFKNILYHADGAESPSTSLDRAVALAPCGWIAPRALTLTGISLRRLIPPTRRARI